MKKILAAGAALGLLAAAPASAKRANHATWEDCMAELATYDTAPIWEGRCASDGQGGWKIVWKNLKRKRR